MSLLRVEHLSKEFGGVHAVEELSFQVEAGTVHSIIGPNGAGKTTLFNLITGIYQPSDGHILFEDHRINNVPPYQLAKRGISRTFQNLQIFFDISALENVLVGMHLRLDRRLGRAFFGLSGRSRAEVEAREEAAELMRFFGLGDYIETEGAAMPYGALKRLEIARAMASKPKMLLLDEPAAGLNPTETTGVGRLIRAIAKSGVTIVLVEHDMRLVMDISDQILVLNYGRKLAEGESDVVRNDPKVIEAYLGSGAIGGHHAA